MDRLAPEELISIPGLIREAISIPKQSPKTFYLITLTLIFPHSLALLADNKHLFFTRPTLLLPLSLLSTAAVVSTVASLYTSSNPPAGSFSSTVSAIPKVLKRLFVTSVIIALLMLAEDVVSLVYRAVLVTPFAALNPLLVAFCYLVILVLFLVVQVWVTALWYMARVVSVVEPICGFSAVKRSCELLKGKAVDAVMLAFGYLATSAVIGSIFESVVVQGGESGGYGVFTRIVVGVFLVGVLVIVDLVGLLVQSVLYYVCKSYHHRQGIDKIMALDDDQLGEYVPLIKSSNIQLENLDD